MISRSEWLKNIISLSNIILDIYGEKLKAKRKKVFFDEFLLNCVEEYMKDSPSITGLECEYIRHSEKKDLTSELWKSAESWESVLLNVAFVCVCEDISRMVKSTLDGNAPRRPNQFKK